MGSNKWFTLEDAKTAFNLFCYVYGIGTLGMPTNFARAGPALAAFAIIFMGFANTLSAVMCSKVLLVAPESVKTYGDLGEWCMGKTGRWLVLISQMGVCFIAPCAFLVLGGILLNSLFPGAFEDKTWIVLMALSCAPVCLTPTLKEGAGTALAGCLGTLIADAIGVGVLLHGMNGHPSVPTSDISFDQVATTFGNLSLAYGASVLVPALQRQHSEPERMPRVIMVTLGLIACLFITLAATGYSAVGCQIAGNLLFTINPDPVTGLTALGFPVNKGAVVLAYLSMQLHISIAYTVILHPVFFIVERLFLGMHKVKEEAIPTTDYITASTPNDEDKTRHSKSIGLSITENDSVEQTHEDEAASYKGNAYKYIPARLVIIGLQVAMSIPLRDHFLDLTDFIGASAITANCIIIPIVFYLKKLWSTIPLWEKTAGIAVVIFCLFFGIFVTIKTGKTLFNPAAADPSDPVFPFCHAEHQFAVYYNATAVKLGNQ